MKYLTWLFLFIMLSATVYPNAGASPCSGQEKTALGVSRPRDTEAEAVLEAKNSALHDLAASIASYVNSRFDIRVKSGGTKPGALIVVTEGDASVTVRLPLTGIRELKREVDRRMGCKFIARVQIAISAAGMRKAAAYVEREAAAFRAFHFFSQRAPGFTETRPGDSGSDYPDYTAWLESRCLVMAFREKAQDSYLDKVDIFLGKLYRDIRVFPESPDGRPVRIIYDAPKYRNPVVRALQKQGFAVFGEDFRLLLTASKSSDEFSAIIKNLPDANTVIFTGIQFGPGLRKRINIDSSVLKEFSRMAQTQFKMNAAVFALPEQILKGDYTEEELFHRISGYAGTARYIALVVSTSNPEPEIPAYKVPGYWRLSFTCTLYDLLTENKIYTNTIEDINFSPLSITGKGDDFPAGTSLPAALLEAVRNIMTYL
jgi:hypothetical protein